MYILANEWFLRPFQRKSLVLPPRLLISVPEDFRIFEGRETCKPKVWDRSPKCQPSHDRGEIDMAYIMNALVVQFRMFLLLAFSVNIMNLDEVKLCGLEKRIRFHFKAQKDYGTQLRKKKTKITQKQL